MNHNRDQALFVFRRITNELQPEPPSPVFCRKVMSKKPSYLADMSLLAQIGLYTLTGLLVFAGVSHFLRPRFYARMLPLWLPAHKFLVALSGGVEIILGIGLLFAPTQSIAAWATIAMLGSYFIVHVYMALSNEAGLGLPKWILWLRIVLQFVLIWWVCMYTN